jgi:hypothetical protein
VAMWLRITAIVVIAEVIGYKTNRDKKNEVTIESRGGSTSSVSFAGGAEYGALARRGRFTRSV